MNPIQLNAWGTAAQVGGDLMSALSHIQYGRDAQQAAVFQAAQLRQNAGQAQASAQRQAFEVSREAEYTASAALAAAAASGGGASDPTVVNLISRNASEFAYRKAVALYQGDDRARSLEMSADAKEYEGKVAKNNATKGALMQGFGASTSLLKGMARESSMLQRFGGGGPNGDQ